MTEFESLTLASPVATSAVNACGPIIEGNVEKLRAHMCTLLIASTSTLTCSWHHWLLSLTALWQ